MIGSRFIQKALIPSVCLFAMFKCFQLIGSSTGGAKVNSGRYNIFLVETNDSKTYLNYRQLCAIESAAKHNPDATVHVKSVRALIKDQEIFSKYPNIQFEIIKIKEALKNTPLNEWWSKNLLAKDDYYRISHTSDALRYVFLYDNGGFYSDLDTITLKTLEPLLKYKAGFPFEESGHYRLTGSFFVAQKNHPFIYYLMERYGADYDGEWMTVGPSLIRKYLSIYCNVTNNTDLLVGKNEESKCDVVTFPYTYHTPIVSWKVKSLFEENRTMRADELANSYQIHFATKNTGKFKLNWNSSNFYELFASLNCPLTNTLAFEAARNNMET
jgi:lactosylceramide 4-alpha-galactosyltransferase